ncbi:type I methionyl aminopeptidase [Desulforamulus aeronauticus]|uniref:Methionine aminopeptidase n=1 Tax=Desulforamulus aeronauticus DSM 10349 TaxID=1121421 RepID=A0A1M6NAU1_9FIRM|nr:type I methionyl aminopeptidase [Desulforamulus aeronauticus]SHJ92860.1 methionine aminopeptidase, type I [Desulforamulus aeronauticus DSM 10349]
MIVLKSPREIAIMGDAGKIVAECHAMLAEKIKPGITTLELDQLTEKLIRSRGAIPSFKGHHGFPATICVAINDVICHGFPSAKELKDGDVVTIDIGALYKGYHGDSAWSYAVGNVSPEIAKLMQVTKECLFLGIEQAQPGKRIGDIGHAIQSHAESLNYGVVREFCGHGIGQSLWEEPQIPHYGRPNRGTLLKPGMTIAIEPMITTGDWRAKLAPDGWTASTIDGSICVQYEHTLAITKDAPVILTEL